MEKTSALRWRAPRPVMGWFSGVEFTGGEVYGVVVAAVRVDCDPLCYRAAVQSTDEEEVEPGRLAQGA